MKTFNIVFLLLTMLSFSYQTTFDKTYFEGPWLMYGYGCDGKEPKPEKCNCTDVGAEVICTKTLGDNCVKTGGETFRFTKPALIETGKNWALTYVVGNARKPSSGHWSNKFSVDTIDKFHSQKRIYVRIGKFKVPELPKPIVPVAVDPIPIPAAVVPVPAVIAGPYVYYYQNYFVGHWNAVGYQCTKDTPKIEKINITRIGNKVQGLKLTGDTCIPAGALTFNFIQPAKLWRGQKFIGNFMIGAPGIATPKVTINNIQVIDLNSFRIGSHVFYRILGPQFRPDGVYINMQPMVGGIYPGPGYVKLNPKRNMRSPVRRFVIVEEETNKPGNC